MGFRITVLIGGVSLIYFSLIGNIYNLQIRKGDFYSVRAQSLYESKGLSTVPRGQIYFTDKRNDAIPASINREYPTIFADTRKIADIESAAASLNRILGTPESELIKILSKENDAYQPIKKRASDTEVAAVKLAKIPGIYIDYSLARYYPFGNMASQVLGFVSQDESNLNKALYGAELYYDGILTSRSTDLYLTIDRNIQSEGERILEDLINRYKASGGTFIVQDPKTGRILAMGNYPDFDPNNYSKYNIKNFINPAVQSIYEPGSIMKLVTMAIGIETGAVTPRTTFFDAGSVTLNGKTIKNHEDKKYGRISMANVIEHSVNTGAVFIQREIGREDFYKYLVKFGFADKTRIDLPHEVTGGLRALERGARDVNFATASFGQGISVTPISLINSIATIANQGIMMKPYLNVNARPEVVGQVITPETSRKVIDMMVGAVNVNKVARIEGYSVAGKTGTAQVPDFKNGGYTNEVINTYTGFAPAYDPKFVILIKLDKPAGSPPAGQTVVPAFRELAKFMLNYYTIPPDNISR